MAVDTEDNQGDDVAGDGDARGNNALNLLPPAGLPAQPSSGGGANIPGGGDDPNGGDDDTEKPDSNESSSESDDHDEDEADDLEWAGMGKFYKAKTPNGEGDGENVQEVL
jgi:hypothetical protein